MATLFGYPFQYQCETNWCWAAVASSVVDFFSSQSFRGQCELANLELKQTCCCYGGGNDSCNQPWCLKSVLDSVNHLEACSAGSLQMGAILSELEGNCPIGIHISWQAATVGHFCTIIGGTSEKAGDRIWLGDPESGRTLVARSSLDGGYRGYGNWDWTYYTEA